MIASITAIHGAECFNARMSHAFALHFDNAFMRDLPGDPESGSRLRQVEGALWSAVAPSAVAAIPYRNSTTSEPSRSTANPTTSASAQSGLAPSRTSDPRRFAANAISWKYIKNKI